jgi:hypothetical protein
MKGRSSRGSFAGTYLRRSIGGGTIPCGRDMKWSGADAWGGRASGECEDFLTGLVVGNRHVWGGPVGITAAQDGSLLVSYDGSNSIWRVSFSGSAGH